MLVNILGIPGLLLLIYLGGLLFAGFVTFVILYALYEFYAMQGKRDVYPQLWTGWLLTLVVGHYYFYRPEVSLTQILAGATAIILLTLIIELFRGKSRPAENLGITYFGILYIAIFLGQMICLRNYDSSHGSRLTFSLFITVWVCDSAAYFVGKRWGVTKIFKRVSPNKSVQGTIAGLIAAIAAYALMNYSGFLGRIYPWHIVLGFGIITGGFGQLGDFIESMFKRATGVKDSGTLLMGHGGVFDRFDSLIVASPLLYLFVTMI